MMKTDWNSALEWLDMCECSSCQYNLICNEFGSAASPICHECENLVTSLAKQFQQVKQALLQEILEEMKQEYKAVEGGGYEGEMAVCMAIVRSKMEDAL